MFIPWLKHWYNSYNFWHNSTEYGEIDGVDQRLQNFTHDSFKNFTANVIWTSCVWALHFQNNFQLRLYQLASGKESSDKCLCINVALCSWLIFWERFFPIATKWSLNLLASSSLLVAFPVVFQHFWSFLWFWCFGELCFYVYDRGFHLEPARTSFDHPDEL